MAVTRAPGTGLNENHRRALTAGLGNVAQLLDKIDAAISEEPGPFTRHAADLTPVEPGDVAGQGKSEAMPRMRGPGLRAAVKALEQALDEITGNARPGAGDGETHGGTLRIHLHARRPAGQ